MGQNPVPPVNIPIPTEIDKSGWRTYPKMVPLVLTHSHKYATHQKALGPRLPSGWLPPPAPLAPPRRNGSSELLAATKGEPSAVVFTKKENGTSQKPFGSEHPPPPPRLGVVFGTPKNWLYFRGIPCKQPEESTLNPKQGSKDWHFGKVTFWRIAPNWSGKAP